MFIKAFFDTKVADGVQYDTLGQLLSNASAVLRVSRADVAEYLLEHPHYVIMLINHPSYIAQRS